MKKILILMTLFMLCGCSAEYTLNIKGEEIKENISFMIDKNIIEENDLEPDLNLYSQDSINHILNDKLYPLTNSTKKIYEKNIKETASAYEVNLDYTYDKQELIDSNVINECFENNDIQINKKEISIHLYGKFNCLNDENDSINFKINTANKIESANIDYDFLTSEFKWTIDKSNENNVDIKIVLSTDTKFKYYGIRVGAVVAIMVLVIVGFKVANLISNKEKANEI